MEATYRNEVARLCAAAPELAVEFPARQALRTWMDRFIEFMATKRGMAEALRAVLVDENERLQTRDLLTAARALLIEMGVVDNSIRPDIRPNDVLMSLGGITLIAGHSDQRELAGRLIDLLMDGLALRPGITFGGQPDTWHVTAATAAGS